MLSYQKEETSKTDNVVDKPDTPEAVVQRCSVKKMFLEISQNSQENTCVRVSFLIKLQASGLDLICPRLLSEFNESWKLYVQIFVH